MLVMFLMYVLKNISTIKIGKNAIVINNIKGKLVINNPENMKKPPYPDCEKVTYTKFSMNKTKAVISNKEFI